VGSVDQDNLLAVVQLQQMVADYWHELDGREARNITDFYAEDCTFRAGANYHYTGRAGVRKFYDDRAVFVRDEKDGARTTRHTFVNLRVTVEDANNASLDFVLVNYSGGGNPPITGFEGPTMVSDVSWVCRRDAGGAWRITHFRGVPQFVSDEPFSVKVLSKKPVPL
jgi:ketosteroid isomerase-like protein